MNLSVAHLTNFLVKIASRCNLACDYCYVYEHSDQTWRGQPVVMSEEHIATLARRIAHYVRHEDIPEINIIFHGGEPLLAGPSRIAAAAEFVRRTVRPETEIVFSLQTNGTLLDVDAVNSFVAARIWVSLSIDGGPRASDLHRLDHARRSSFAATLNALRLLEDTPSIYGGLISVVDPRVSPTELFDFIGPRNPPLWDILLPDAHHERRPPGRDADSELYKRWLLDAFDIWFDEYPGIALRTFDAVLARCAGLSSATDVFGLGTPNLLTIETDGSYHGFDVFKITEPGATSIGLCLDSHAIEDAAASPAMLAYGALLRVDGLSEECQRCPEVGVCGGGSVPHRYSSSGLRNPTVYCAEMLALIAHARERMYSVLSPVTPSAHLDRH